MREFPVRIPSIEPKIRRSRVERLQCDPLRDGGAHRLRPAHAFQVPHYALLNFCGQRAKRHNQAGKAIISRKQVCHWHSQRSRQPLRRKHIRLVHPAFISVDACTGHKTIQASGDSELLLRQPLPLARLLQTSRKDSLWADFWGHDPNRVGETPTRFVTFSCLRYYELRSITLHETIRGVRAMSIQLVVDGSDGIEIPLEDSLLAAWRLQLDRAALTRSTFAMTERLAACFAASLCQCLDPDLRPPTEKQLRHALTIARELNIPISADAMRYRGSMLAFIKSHEPNLKEGVARHSTSEATSDGE